MNKVWISLKYIGVKTVIVIHINVNVLSWLITIYLAEKKSSWEIIDALNAYADRVMIIPIRMIKEYEQIYMQRSEKVVGTVSLSCMP